jgi:hypothetical protein
MNNIEHIKNKYEFLCEKKSDINEHLPTLFKYSCECESILECGVRYCVSSYALLYGLLNNNKNKKKIILNDVLELNIDEILNLTNDLDVDLSYKWISNLELKLNENIDLTFIDTWHVYGQLKRELNKYGKITNKYIIMHDTTIDGENSESVRNKHDISEKMIKYNYTYEEVTEGLWKAIEEFLSENKEWVILERYTNNNGLTILKNINNVK